RRLPAGATAFEYPDIGVAHRTKALGRLLRQSLAAAVEHHHGRARARHQVVDHELKPGERRRRGEEWVATVMHALLARVEQRELRAAGELGADGCEGHLFCHDRCIMTPAAFFWREPWHS